MFLSKNWCELLEYQSFLRSEIIIYISAVNMEMLKHYTDHQFHTPKGLVTILYQHPPFQSDNVFMKIQSLSNYFVWELLMLIIFAYEYEILLYDFNADINYI